jgi:hypothetical protein
MFDFFYYRLRSKGADRIEIGGLMPMCNHVDWHM